MKTGKQRRANRKWREMLPRMWSRKLLDEAFSNLRFVRTTLERAKLRSDEAQSEGSIMTFKKLSPPPKTAG